jgi:hypothetical protein
MEDRRKGGSKNCTREGRKVGRREERKEERRECQLSLSIYPCRNMFHII